jgi:hypothetical protein
MLAGHIALLLYLFPCWHASCLITVQALPNPCPSSSHIQEGAEGQTPCLLIGLLNSELQLESLPEVEVLQRVQSLATVRKDNYEGMLELCGTMPVVTFPLRGKTLVSALDSGILGMSSEL